MKWEKVSFAPDNEVYHLYEGDEKVLSMSFHPFSQSARVETATEKRVFQIRKEGFLRNKTVLRSEYGIKIGELGHDAGKHFISIDNHRYYYSIENNQGTALSIYKEDKGSPLATCGLNTGIGELQISNTLNEKSQTGLLMTFCWYLFLSVSHPQGLEMAH